MSPPTTVVATVLSDDFEPGFIVALESLLEHNPWFGHEIRVLSNSGIAPLSSATRQRLNRRYDRLTFIEVDLARQQRLSAIRERVLRSPPQAHASFVILEALRFNDVDRAVALDCDIVVLGDVQQLFDVEEHFAAVEANHLATGPRGFFNAGIAVYNKEHLTGETYRILTEELVLERQDTKRGPGEQAVLNKFFATREHRWLPTKYNVQKRLVPDTIGDVAAELARLDTRILHFIGEKPWQAKRTDRESNYTQVERLWELAFARYADADDLERALSTRRATLFSSNAGI